MCKLFIHDIKEGIIKNKRFAIVIIWFIILSAYILIFPLSTINAKEITLFDMLLYFYKGEDPMLNATLNNEPIVFPLFWMINFLLILFVVADYMYDDISGFGIQYIVRIKRRSMWWISKCIFCMGACIAFFAICVVVSMLVTLCIGGKPFEFTNSDALLNNIANEMNYYTMNLKNDIDLSTYNLIICEIMVPFMVSWAVCQIQMTLTLFFKPIVSFVVNCGLILISAYVQNIVPGLFISWGMTLHNSNFICEGFNTSECIVCCIVAIAIAIILGMLKFKKYNFVEG